MFSARLSGPKIFQSLLAHQEALSEQVSSHKALSLVLEKRTGSSFPLHKTSLSLSHIRKERVLSNSLEKIKRRAGITERRHVSPSLLGM